MSTSSVRQRSVYLKKIDRLPSCGDNWSWIDSGSGSCREDIAWPQVLELLVVNRLIDPGSKFRLHRQWFDETAIDVFGVDFAVEEKDRLYRCLDRILAHRQELFQHLQASGGKRCSTCNSMCGMN